MALKNCDVCYRPNELAGMLASAGIQKTPAARMFAVKETDRCIAIEHPFRKLKYHFVVFPKRDIKDIADIAIDDQRHVFDCLALIRLLIVENGIRYYRVETNGPDRQHVTYLHFHLIGSDGYARPGTTDDPRKGISF
jgi:diadenosine tetraphosphate (Ap4A) HIT family hydrolase